MSRFLKAISCINKFGYYARNGPFPCHVISRKNFSHERVFERGKSAKLSPLPPKLQSRRQQNYDYFLVLDFEATCDAPMNLIPQEIIEFPVLKVSGQTFEIESVFHSYVKPRVHSELTSFCTELTGIIQDMVEDQSFFEEVYTNFNQWMKAEGILQPNVKFAFVTCGDWDLKYLFEVQCKLLRIPIPEYMVKWINVKMCFAEATQIWPRNLTTMLNICGLKQEGRLHSGIDDCRNVVNIIKDLADRGHLFELNSPSL